MTEFYDNLLKATSNIDDITTERYATVTKLNGNYCDVKEEDTGLEHTNVPIVNGANLSVGDKAIIGFLNNSIYDAVCYGALDKQIHDDSKQDLLVSGTNIKTINHQSLLGSGNITIEGGGGSDVDIVTSWEPTPSDTKVPSEKLTKNTLDTKVDKVTGKGLSTNDFTNSYKNTIDGLSTVATTGDYDDLTDKPTIPSKISDLTNDSDFIEKSSTTGLVKNDGTIDTTSYSTFDGDYDSLTNKPSIPSKTSELTNDGDGTNVFVKNNDSRLSDSRTPTSHRASATTYGVGNASYYGHCRVINNLTKSSHTDGYALSAYQGYILKQDVDGKASSTHNHTKSDITDFPTLHTVATSGSYNDLLDKPNIPSGVVVDLNLDGTSNNAVANSAVVGGLNDKIEASDISFGFDADTKEIYIEVN